MDIFADLHDVSAHIVSYNGISAGIWILACSSPSRTIHEMRLEMWYQSDAGLCRVQFDHYIVVTLGSRAGIWRTVDRASGGESKLNSWTIGSNIGTPVALYRGEQPKGGTVGLRRHGVSENSHRLNTEVKHGMPATIYLTSTRNTEQGWRQDNIGAINRAEYHCTS